MAAAARSLIFTFRPCTTNIGNDLIALAIEGLLDVAWPGPLDVVALPSAGSGRGAKTAGMSAANVYEANLLADAVLVGGGNVFENGALDVDANALDALQPPLAVVAASTGRVRGRDGWLARRTDGSPPERVAHVCRLADPLLVRDEATAAYLAELGIDHATVAGCPSLFLDRFVADLPRGDDELAGTALLSLRNPQLMSVSYAEQGRVQRDVRRLVDGLREDYDRVALLCHDYQDLAFAAGFEDVEVRYTEDPRRLIGWLRGCAVAAGYRLHGFLASVALGVKAVHVSYDERGESMLETLDLRAFDVPLHATADVAGEVCDRLRALGASTLRDAAEPALARLGEALVDGVETLAARAADHRGGRLEIAP
ncbi:MAG: hypothetical protein QOJ35_441 [Solirubrobacteraceae bacterium]|jgi:hypothetical protein|nr:hypothetical protein [Solirubrobacteraceae bacterium]